MRIVVDASIAIKWFLPEQQSAQAEVFLSENYQRVAPELLLTEVKPSSNKLKYRVKGSPTGCLLWFPAVMLDPS